MSRETHKNNFLLENEKLKKKSDAYLLKIETLEDSIDQKNPL